MGAGRRLRGQVLAKGEGARGASGTPSPPSWLTPGVRRVPPKTGDCWVGPGWTAQGPGGVGGLSLQGGWGLSPRGFAFFFFRSIFFFSKSILFRGGARAAAEKRDTPARSQGFRTEGKELRRVVRLPALRGHFSRATPNSPVTSARPQVAHPPGAPDNLRGGARRKFAAPAARLRASRPRRLSARQPARPPVRPCPGPRPAPPPPP